MMLSPSVSALELGGFSAFWDRRPASYKLPRNICPTDSCVCAGLLDEKDLAPGAAPAGFLFFSCLEEWVSDGVFRASAWWERKEYQSHIESRVLYGSLFPPGLAGSRKTRGIRLALCL